MKKDLVKKQSEKILFRNQGLSGQSRQVYTTAVKQYRRFISNNNIPEGIESIKTWLGTFENAKTFNIKLQAIKEFFLKYFEHETAEKRLQLREGLDSIKRRKPKVSIEKTGFLTQEQVDKLIAGMSEKTGLFTEALFWTGCRISELLNIKIKDCKVNGIVEIRIKSGKGGKEHQVYLSKCIYERILKVFNGKTYLFETRAGTTYSRINVTNYIKRESKKILHISISAHTLRHSKAMYLKDEKGLTPDQIAKSLNHSSVLTTLQHYFHGTPTPAEQGIF